MYYKIHDYIYIYIFYFKLVDVFVALLILIIQFHYYYYYLEYQASLEGLKKEYNLDSSFTAPIFLKYMPPQTNKGTGLTK